MGHTRTSLSFAPAAFLPHPRAVDVLGIFHNKYFPKHTNKIHILLPLPDLFPWVLFAVHRDVGLHAAGEGFLFAFTIQRTRAQAAPCKRLDMFPVFCIYSRNALFSCSSPGPGFWFCTGYLPNQRANVSVGGQISHSLCSLQEMSNQVLSRNVRESTSIPHKIKRVLFKLLDFYHF